MKKTIIISLLFLALQFCSGKKSETIKVQGITDADIITLKSATAGKVKKIFFDTGDRILKEKLLLKIDSEKTENKIKEIELGLKEVELNSEKLILKKKILKDKIAYLKKQYERLKRLSIKKAVSGEKLERAKLSLDEALLSEKDVEKSLKLLKLKREKLINQKDYILLNLKDFEVKSPVNGMILDRFVSEGENVFPGSPLFDVYDEDSLYIEVFLEEGEIGRLKLHQQVRITMDGAEDKELTGEIFYFGKKAEFSPKYIVSEKERKELLYQVKIRVKNHKELYKIGMPVTVEIK